MPAWIIQGDVALNWKMKLWCLFVILPIPIRKIKVVVTLIKVILKPTFILKPSMQNFRKNIFHEMKSFRIQMKAVQCPRKGYHGIFILS